MTETETIDRLFLELSQFTTARTARELRLEREMEAHRQVGCTVSMERTLRERDEARAIARRLRNMELEDIGVLAEFDALPWAKEA